MAEPDLIRVAGVQLENVVGDLAGNGERILDAMRWAEEQEADVVVFPELALTGYPLADLVLREEFVDAALERVRQIAEQSGHTAAVIGTVDRGPPPPPRRGARGTRATATWPSARRWPATASCAASTTRPCCRTTRSSTRRV